MSHTLNTTLEINEDGEWAEYEFEITFTVSPFVPAKLWGLPENCYPAEGGEVEIEKIECTDTKRTFSEREWVLMKNWLAIDTASVPTYRYGDLEDECRESVEHDDYDCDPDSGTDAYRDREEDDYINW
jgi:hypothetical protein